MVLDEGMQEEQSEEGEEENVKEDSLDTRDSEQGSEAEEEETETTDEEDAEEDGAVIIRSVRGALAREQLESAFGLRLCSGHVRD